MTRLAADVCVVGGGPAGSTVAGQLAALGHSVILVEAQTFPRPRIAATLPPGILPLLDAAGVRGSIERAGFPRADWPIVRWPHVRDGPLRSMTPAGLHVDRGMFDQILLDHARERGVRILERAWAARPEKHTCCERWLTAVSAPRGDLRIASRLVVDASGRQLLRGRRRRFAPPTVAVYEYWTRPRQVDVAARIEAGEAQWIWHAPVSHSHAVAAVFLDPKRLSGLTPSGITRLYRELVSESDLIGRCLGHSLGGQATVCDATSRASSEHADVDSIRVGDASLALDPLSSQGVQAAIAGALQAAIVGNTLLVHPSTAEAAVRFYQERQSERLEQHRSKAAQLYAEVAQRYDHPFWVGRAAGADAKDAPKLHTERLVPSRKIRLAADVRFEEVPTIEANIVVNRLALRCGGASRPVAYLEGVQLAHLLQNTTLEKSASLVAEDWRRFQPEDLSWQIIHWLWDNRILVAHE